MLSLRRPRGGERAHQSLELVARRGARDDKKIQDFNYRATKEALARAVKGEPKASEVTAKKDAAHHPFAAG
jgi:formaldehyde-activating enzyme